MIVTALEQFLVNGVFSFIICFVRLGAALMIMPIFGDSFISTRVRLLMAFAISFVLFPLVMDHVPNPAPTGVLLFALIAMEFIVGILIGTVAKILMMALDTAGMMISMQSGLANAQLFNPALSTQGSIIGGFLSITGAVLLLATNMHHLLLTAAVESYELFPLGSIPDTGAMAQLISGTISKSFEVGIKMAAPFFVIVLLMYVGMGVLSRLMPQLQVIMVALPLQLAVAFSMFGFVLSGVMLYWLLEFEKGMVFFLSQAGG